MATPVRGGAGKAPSASALASTRLAPFAHWLSSAACCSPRSAVGLAVLVDRGGRQLPVAAEFAAARVVLPATQSLQLARAEEGAFSFHVEDKG